MSTNEQHNDVHNSAAAAATHNHTGGTTNGNVTGHSADVNTKHEFEKATQHMTHEEKHAAVQASRFGYGPLAHVRSSDPGGLLPAFGGEFQPGLYKPVKDRKFANPAPLGLCAFALTTFVLSLLNLGTNGITAPNIVIGSAFAYGGLVQLLAGMWEMAVGNTFGATALSSYGGFWIATAITLTPGGFEVMASLNEELGSADAGANAFAYSFSFYLFGWFIFTTLLVLCTLKSTVAFFFLFFTLDLAFLTLALGYFYHDAAGPQPQLIKAGGGFGILAAFAAWYNAFAGIADTSNSFFVIPVAHFPWSETGKIRRGRKTADQMA